MDRIFSRQRIFRNVLKTRNNLLHSKLKGILVKDGEGNDQMGMTIFLNVHYRDMKSLFRDISTSS